MPSPTPSFATSSTLPADEPHPLDACLAWYQLCEPRPWQLELAVHPSLIETQTPPNPLASWWPRLQACLPAFLQAFHTQHQAVGLHQPLQLAMTLPNDAAWSIDCTLVDDTTMAWLNNEHRGKPTPTDVLTFPALDTESLAELPPFLQQQLRQQGGCLGSIVLSLDYARQHLFTPVEGMPTPSYLQAPFFSKQTVAPLCFDPSLAEHQQALCGYVLERLCHGLLHLHEQHHATEADFKTVVAFQKAVLDAVF
ncbi:MAG: rRNA maturation RNAse YbeY [Vampirovibrionales bacterium]